MGVDSEPERDLTGGWRDLKAEAIEGDWSQTDRTD